MKKWLVCCAVLALYAGNVSGKYLDLVEEPPEPVLEGTLMPHPFAAWRLGHEVLDDFGGRSAHGADFPPELVQAGFDCPGFAEKGDLLWDFRACEDMMIAGWAGRIGVVTTAWIHPGTARVWGWWGVEGPAREIEHRFGVHNPWKRIETPVMARNPETGETNVPATEIKYIDREGDRLVSWREDGGAESRGEEKVRRERFWESKGTVFEQRFPVEWEKVGAGTREDVLEKARRSAMRRGIVTDGTATVESKLYPTGCGIPRFCKRGEWVLDVRFVRPGEGKAPPGCRMVCLELLIRTVTGETFCVVGPAEQLGKWEDDGPVAGADASE